MVKRQPAKQYLSNFNSSPLTCDSTVFPGKIIPNIAKSNRNFPGKGRGDKDFIFTYLDSSMAEVFPHYFLFFSILIIFRKKRRLKVERKVLTLGPSLFHKYSNPSKKFSNSVFVCQSATSGESFDNIGPQWGTKGPKTSQKGLFHGC